MKINVGPATVRGGLRWLGKPRLAIALGCFLLIEGVSAQESASVQTNASRTVVANQSVTNHVTRPDYASSADASPAPVSLRPFQLVLQQSHLLGDWFGLQPLAQTNGIIPNVSFVSDMAGNVTGGRSEGFAEADNLGLDLLFNLQQIAGLQGGSIHVSAAERSGTSLTVDNVGNVFNIQQDYGGQFFHLIDLCFEEELFRDRLEFVIGRIAAGDDFLVSPADYVFMQNAFDGNPVGIFFNAPGMTAYPNAAWGTRVKFRPTPRTYLMAGLYDGNTAIRSSAYNGADFSLDGPLFFIAEACYHNNGLPGDSKYIGDYKAGFWYDNHEFQDYKTLGYGTPVQYQRGSWGFYGLFDQLLLPFRDPANDRGVGLTGSITVAPDPAISQLPYFATAGIICRGLAASRPQDLLALGIVYGEFSQDLKAAEDRESQTDPLVMPQNHESVVELTYRFRFRKNSLFIQPDLQWVIRPGGTGRYSDALVLGSQVGINF